MRDLACSISVAVLFARAGRPGRAARASCACLLFREPPPSASATAAPRRRADDPPRHRCRPDQLVEEGDVLGRAFPQVGEVAIEVADDRDRAVGPVVWLSRRVEASFVGASRGPPVRSDRGRLAIGETARRPKPPGRPGAAGRTVSARPRLGTRTMRCSAGAAIDSSAFSRRCSAAASNFCRVMVGQCPSAMRSRLPSPCARARSDCPWQNPR